MPSTSPLPETTLASRSRAAENRAARWRKRYAELHRPRRVTEFPEGIVPPKKVRVYRRNHYYLLQWWDPRQKGTLSERVEGDFVAAIARARQIDQRLSHFHTSGHRRRPVGHQELVGGYLIDLTRRANAGEIDPRTVTRYASTLTNHYLTYALRPDVERQCRHVAAVNRDFQLGFAAFLANTSVRPNGHPNGRLRPMRGQGYVMDVVRAMFEWAADPDRGALLGDGFRNPFVRRTQQRHAPPPSQFGEPDITIAMAAEFFKACDAYQLRLFAPMAVYGLRAAEPCMFFREHLGPDWLVVPCIPQLAYLTKGRREKRLPVIPCISLLLEPIQGHPPTGLVYVRRSVVTGAETPPLAGAALDALGQELQRRAVDNVLTAADRRRVRDQLLREAGAITYDHIVGEFRKLTRALAWPQAATIKDFRHLFATCLENAGMPEHYRKFVLGQSPGRAAIVTYTHLNKIKQHYNRAVADELRPLIAAVEGRATELGLGAGDTSRPDPGCRDVFVPCDLSGQHVTAGGLYG